MECLFACSSRFVCSVLRVAVVSQGQEGTPVRKQLSELRYIIWRECHGQRSGRVCCLSARRPHISSPDGNYLNVRQYHPNFLFLSGIRNAENVNVTAW